ncbi:hypothetical protein Aduo_007037 [Ancylostoma duodenale]
MTRGLLLLVSVPLIACGLVIWPDPVNDEAKLSRPKPTTWKEKNLGQWCRNFTVNQHVQCPQASVFHQFDCCGQHLTECCFAIQGWVIVLGSLIAFVVAASVAFYLLLKFQLICLEHSYPPKVIYLGGKC